MPVSSCSRNLAGSIAFQLTPRKVRSHSRQFLVKFVQPTQAVESDENLVQIPNSITLGFAVVLGLAADNSVTPYQNEQQGGHPSPS